MLIVARRNLPPNQQYLSPDRERGCSYRNPTLHFALGVIWPLAGKRRRERTSLSLPQPLMGLPYTSCWEFLWRPREHAKEGESGSWDSVKLEPVRHATYRWRNGSWASLSLDSLDIAWSLASLTAIRCRCSLLRGARCGESDLGTVFTNNERSIKLAAVIPAHRTKCMGSRRCARVLDRSRAQVSGVVSREWSRSKYRLDYRNHVRKSCMDSIIRKLRQNACSRQEKELLSTVGDRIEIRREDGIRIDGLITLLSKYREAKEEKVPFSRSFSLRLKKRHFTSGFVELGKKRHL